jgi:hypothetical protein
MNAPSYFSTIKTGGLVQAVQVAGDPADIVAWLTDHGIPAAVEHTGTVPRRVKVAFVLDRYGAHVAAWGDWIVHDRASTSRRWCRMDARAFERTYRVTRTSQRAAA